MAGSTGGIGSDVVNAMGYDGSGMMVAVLDTGLDTDHVAFATAPQVQTLTLEELETRMNQVQLHAELDGAEAVSYTHLIHRRVPIFPQLGG